MAILEATNRKDTTEVYKIKPKELALTKTVNASKLIIREGSEREIGHIEASRGSDRKGIRRSTYT